MQPSVVWLLRDQSLHEAAAVLSEHDISGAPVCDRNGNVLGMLTKTDMVEHLAMDEDGQSVENAMTPGAIGVTAEDPLERAISRMAFEGIHRLVVLEEGRLVGIITAMDVLRELAGFGRKDDTRIIAVAPPSDGE